jgi:hypothetical protein
MTLTLPVKRKKNFSRLLLWRHRPFLSPTPFIVHRSIDPPSFHSFNHNQLPSIVNSLILFVSLFVIGFPYAANCPTCSELLPSELLSELSALRMSARAAFRQLQPLLLYRRTLVRVDCREVRQQISHGINQPLLLLCKCFSLSIFFFFMRPRKLCS